MTRVPPRPDIGRRTFLRRSGALALACASPAATAAAFRALAAVDARAGKRKTLHATADATTGLDLLKLPEGFSYASFGWAGDVMADGIVTPGRHDGMGVAAESGGVAVLIRNHELPGARRAFTPPSKTYDPFAPAGTTTLLFDLVEGRWIDARASLGGTVRNCAGGVAPWGAWLSCEETTRGPSSPGPRSHGWVFEIPAHGEAVPTPLRDMGRFKHEAVAVDPATHFAYLTEDQETSGFYRFLPYQPDRFRDGGRLQMLKIASARRADLTGSLPAGTTFDTQWVDIAEPTRAHRPATSDGLGVFGQGFAEGGAVIRRGEGCWQQGGAIFFVSTDGGRGFGQVWRHDTREETLTLIFESPNAMTLDRPDNIAVSHRGDIVLCEDGGSLVASDDIGARMMALTHDGRTAPVAENNMVLRGERNGLSGDWRSSEWAGATFSADGAWLFANLQSPGVTFAITGPWDSVYG